jgi:LmbE family N-acetylglucosaminyl deacetylase
MASDALPITRKDFLLTVAGTLLLSRDSQAQPQPGKVLLVVAHPDDEYACAGALYRLVREQGWTADQVVITDGEAGYRYAALAEAFYGVSLAAERDGRAHLREIRKREVLRAGRILGIRKHYFFDQKDLGFSTDAASADSSNWDRPRLAAALYDLLLRERYDAVFALLPTAQTHGHHRAATLLALDAVASLPPDARPLVFGAEPAGAAGPPLRFTGLPAEPLVATTTAEPLWIFDRTDSFGYRRALNYQIVVNWVIAEHKSQGLFQSDYGRHQTEQFWLFAVSGSAGIRRHPELTSQLNPR